MLKTLLSVFISLWAVAATAQSVVYVDAGASGDDDGTTWANAYTDLQVAIDSSEAGSSLWIAAGRYVTPDTASFYIDRGLSLYGGFDGTETSAEEADPAGNETILSGDVMGNDEMMYDSLLAIDNNRVLTIIDTNVTSAFTVTLDGLTIRVGAIAANFPDTVSLLGYAGGGILSTARLDVSRVYFTANRADFGAATALIFSTASGSAFDRITSEGNFNRFRASHYSNSADSVSYTNSTFTGSEDGPDVSGMIFSLFGNGLMVDSCTFTNIDASESVGAAIRTSSALGQKIMNSTFTNLNAAFGGGAIYAVNGDFFDAGRTPDAGEFLVDNCTFTDMSTAPESRGGGIYLDRISATVSNSEFNSGSALVGGAIYGVHGGEDTLVYKVVIDNSSFTENESEAGGAICFLTYAYDFEITDNTFDRNVGGTFGGGGLYLGGTAGTDRPALIMGNEFTGNASTAGLGSAVRIISFDADTRDNTFTGSLGSSANLSLQGLGSDYTVVNSTFSENGTSANPFNRGAGVGAFGGGMNIRIDSSSFDGNLVADEQGFLSGGAAIYIEAVADSVTNVTVANSEFTNNAVSEADGGAIMAVENFRLTVENSDFIANTASTGGAISATRYVVRDSVGDPVQPFQYDSLVSPTIMISKSLFASNLAGGQGGAINTYDVSVDTRNSVLTNNGVARGQGSGGAIIINGSGSLYSNLDNYLINNTFYNNVDGGREAQDTLPGSVGNAVALYQPGNTDSTRNSNALTIQNNAFFMDGPEEESIGLERNLGDAQDPVGFGAITLISLGGNYFNSTSDFAADFTGDTDMDLVDTEFDLEGNLIDPLESDRNSQFPNLNLLENQGNNPLVDAGTTGPLVPEDDFYGTLRDDMPDIGAFELGSEPPVATAEPIANSGLSFQFFPNPTTEVVNIVNEDAAVREFTVLVTDVQGRFITGRKYSGVNNKLNVSALPEGVYNLTLLINGKAYSQQIMKQ